MLDKITFSKKGWFYLLGLPMIVFIIGGLIDGLTPGSISEGDIISQQIMIFSITVGVFIMGFCSAFLFANKTDIFSRTLVKVTES